MHLLYNTHGKDGTPVILLPNKRKGLEERVAWVHTLCALFIGDRKKSHLVARRTVLAWAKVMMKKTMTMTTSNMMKMMKKGTSQTAN